MSWLVGWVGWLVVVVEWRSLWKFGEGRCWGNTTTKNHQGSYVICIVNKMAERIVVRIIGGSTIDGDLAKIFGPKQIRTQQAWNIFHTRRKELKSARKCHKGRWLWFSLTNLTNICRLGGWNTMNMLVLVCSDVWLAGFNRDVAVSRSWGLMFVANRRIGTCARVRRQICCPIEQHITYLGVWANYSDLSWGPRKKRWFSMGILLKCLRFRFGS